MRAMKPSLQPLHAVERALATRGRTKFLDKGGRWEGGPHRHQRWILSDLEFRAVPVRGQMLRAVASDIVYCRLQKHTDDKETVWTLDTASQDPSGECRCRHWPAPDGGELPADAPGEERAP